MFRGQLLDDAQKKSVSIEKAIGSQKRLEDEKQRKVDAELAKLKTESIKLHTKILQLQIMDKSKRRSELIGK